MFLEKLIITNIDSFYFPQMKKRHKRKANKSPRGKNEPPAMFSSTFLQMWPSMPSAKASQAKEHDVNKGTEHNINKGAKHAVNKGLKGTKNMSTKASQPQSWRKHLAIIFGYGSNVTRNKKI